MSLTSGVLVHSMYERHTVTASRDVIASHVGDVT